MRANLSGRGLFRPLLLLVCTGLMVLAGASSGAEAAIASGGGVWPMAGQNLNNTRNQAAETGIGPSNVGQLAPAWTFTTGGDVSATPTVSDDSVFVPDWAGNMFRIDAATGAKVWSHKVAEYDGIAGAFSRTNPALYRSTLIFGDQNGAHLIAVDKAKGRKVWVTQLDSHPAAVITQSPVVYGNRVYVGVSSVEENFATDPSYACCTFRGSMMALDAQTGAILWKTYMVPDNGGQPGGYSGGAIWGSTAVVDGRRGSLYITTGNNYDVPQSVKDCQAADPTSSSCLAPDDHIDSFVALNLNTGAIKWATRLQGYDAWTVACISGAGTNPNCPTPAGPDYDFGQGPMLFTAGGRQLLAAGQKSGFFWALDPATGRVVWSTVVGPGGTLGGSEWGSATDGQRIYVAIANSTHQPYTLVSGQTTTGGAWSALNAATGAIIWQTADPLGDIDPGAVTTANGVVYAGSMDPAGHMYGLEAATGAIRWTFASGGSVNSGAAVANGRVYWGSGYSHIAGTPNNKVYAFGLQ